MGSSPFTSLMSWNGQRSPEKKKSGGNTAEKIKGAKSNGDLKSAENKRTKSTGDVKSAKTKRAKSADDKRVANNKAPTPNGVHYILFQQRTKGVEGFTIATARLQQRVSHVQGWVSCQSKSLAHPLDPLRRRSAVVFKEQKKREAKETRMQKEASARVSAEQKLVSYMEKMIAKDYEDINREVERLTKKRNALAEKRARSLEKQLSVK